MGVWDIVRAKRVATSFQPETFEQESNAMTTTSLCFLEKQKCSKEKLL